MRGHFVSILLLAATISLTCGGSASVDDPIPRDASTGAPRIMATEGIIAFYSERDGDAEIFVINADGSEERRLTDNEANDVCPAWSPDGASIAFESDRDDPNPVKCFPECVSKIYVMNADGSAVRKLLDLPTSEGHPSWSPDGTRIAFNADRDGDGRSAIWSANVDGSDARQLTDDELDARFPDWSPDGAHIAFTSSRSGDPDIWVMDSDGRNPRKLVDTGLSDYFPDWSPNGTMLAFFALRPRESRQDIYVVRSDGTGIEKLTDSPAVIDESPAWSPDGEWIAFQTNRDGNFEIYLMRADGTDARNLTRSEARDYWPDWTAAPK